ncbi:MAG: site-2 protease family protein [Oscillospiraceae bacterium]|nr:site-2 protease family protein [Oscillospiraceae bacterium]
MFIAIAIIAFGVLIAVHELGHFIAAKLLGVRVNEFAIGMGPKILKKQGKETLYTLRLLPFGGFCAMEEDEEATDSRSFTAQSRWRRVIILAAGGAANFIAAFIIIVILFAGAQGFGGTTIVSLDDSFPNAGEQGLMVGDTIVSINGERLFYADDFHMFMNLAENRGDGVVDLVILRDGERITRNRFPLERREFETETGETVMRFGITFNSIEGTTWQRLRYSGYTAINYVRIIRVSLAELISGAFGVRDMHGAVGIIGEMGNIGQSAPTVRAGLGNIAYMTAFIGVNLAVMNLLPIPALDGGRILFLFISWVIEKITRRKLDPKYEGYIHTAAMVLLMGFMAFMLINDVLRIVGAGNGG